LKLGDGLSDLNKEASAETEAFDFLSQEFNFLLQEKVFATTSSREAAAWDSPAGKCREL
jgi:hypothetical protein